MNGKIKSDTVYVATWIAMIVLIISAVIATTICFGYSFLIGIMPLIGITFIIYKKKKRKEKDSQKNPNRMIVTIKSIWIALILSLAFFLSISLSRLLILNEKTIITWPWLIISMTIIYFGFCFIRIRGEYKGIKEIIGIPYVFVDSGPHWVWWPIEKIALFPKQQQKIEIKKQQIITIPGTEKNGNANTTEYSAATLDADVTFYFIWPNNDNLIKSYQKGPNPDDRDAIQIFFEDAIIDATRGVGGRKTWRACTQERKKFANEITQDLKDDPDGPVAQCGITDIRVFVTDIKLPPDLEKAISAPQIAELNKIAAISEGEGEGGKKEKIGIGEAAARQAIFATIATQKDSGLAYETLLTLRKMADGTSTTMFYGLPTQLNEVLDTALGGKKKTTENIIALLGGKEGIEDLIASFHKISKKLGD